MMYIFNLKSLWREKIADSFWVELPDGCTRDSTVLEKYTYILNVSTFEDSIDINSPINKWDIICFQLKKEPQTMLKRECVWF